MVLAISPTPHLQLHLSSFFLFFFSHILLFVYFSDNVNYGTRGMGGGGEGVTSYIWHSTDVRAEWPPFPALPGI